MVTERETDGDVLNDDYLSLTFQPTLREQLPTYIVGLMVFH